jgi:hypothetical protein
MLVKKSKWVCMILLIAVTCFFVISSTAFAGDKNGVTQEGIKVHGHWKIEVFNPDGTQMSVTEFENSLVSGGGFYPVKLLTGQAVHAAWGIQLDNTGGTNPCDNAGSPDPCRIGESGANYLSLIIHSTNLTVSTTTNSFTLSGSVTAANTSTINKVQTAWSMCTSTTVTLTDCRPSPNNVWGFLTATTLTTPPSVVPGQLIQVTVTISFS